MATAQIFDREVVANKSPRNCFTTGYSSLFTCPTGMLLPCFSEHVRAGDKLKLGISNVTRTRPLNTSAFMSFDEVVEFWYVPYYLIWSEYDNWKIAQNYRHRSNELSNAGKQVLHPYFRYADIARFLKTFTNAVPDPIQRFNQPNVPDTIRLLDMLNYCAPRVDNYTNISYDTTYLASGGDTNQGLLRQVISFYEGLSSYVPVNYWSLCAYQCIYMNCYRNEEYEPLDPTYYNLDNIYNNMDENNSLRPTTLPSYTTPTCLAPTTVASATGMNNVISAAKLFTPRYKNWRRDIFTYAKPYSGFSSGNGLQLQGGGQVPTLNQLGTSFYWPASNSSVFSNGVPKQGFNDPTVANNSDVVLSNSAPESFMNIANNPQLVFQRLYGNGTVSNNTATVGTYLYPQNIRNLLAQDKFVRSAIYADKNLNAQMKALFGESYKDTHTPMYLGSYKQNIEINDVTANSSGTTGGTSTLSTATLGMIGGKVLSPSGKDTVFEREFDYDGVVLGIHYIVPRNNYDSYRINKFNTKVSRWDYFNPNFDGLGLSPTFTFERNVALTEDMEDAPPTALFGYNPRYYEYKQRTNEVHSTFQSSQPDNFWTLTNNSDVVLNASSVFNLKVLPNITDRLFTVDFNGAPSTDPFMVYMNFDVKRISNMEVYGTPQI